MLKQDFLLKSLKQWHLRMLSCESGLLDFNTTNIWRIDSLAYNLQFCKEVLQLRCSYVCCLILSLNFKPSMEFHRNLHGVS